ncbi:polysaccharide deacetylase family protein [Sinanaerobacter chloroacetimidivorans]|nr:polysaccharide deacetylase family protein [Sinanaerobacter chloroacetimidivorans]
MYRKCFAMYLGSVKFFKHFIVGIVLLLIIGLSFAAVYLAVMNKNYQKQISELHSETVLAQSTEKPDRSQESEALEYQELYPEMYADLSEKTTVSPHTIYLTFDDGPSDRTAEILDILKEKNVKATFFVIGKEGPKEKELMRRIVDEGHTIAIHTYSHKYEDIYESVESYLADFNKIYHLIYETTGVKPDMFRFPGGSLNIYNARLQMELSSELTRRGFTYYDWNSSSGDADIKTTKDSVYANTTKSAANKDRVIILMHDSVKKKDTVAALPDIIEYFKAKGYDFDKLTNDVKPVAFNYKEE